MTPPFEKILIANRGEIAVRVARTCRVMGIRSVAVYSDADVQALHVRAADEAVRIGPAEARASYLDIDKVVSAAKSKGAAAVHPGYGFLSQNGDFADACARAGLVFIGAPGDVHRRMGDKKAARRLMAAAGVPVVPGYDGDDQQDAALAAAAERIGYPLMLKPSRGGGGKGMRVVRRGEDFEAALQASRREALSAFGDDAMVLERFVERPRHVEVQILADAHGHCLHLHERECSIQRRHQKIIEETPSLALDAKTRRELLAAGVAAARAAAYVNAGTVEFLLSPDGRFYFLEMNTRLQVEHPVTEMVTGLDLVRFQIEIAAGHPLPIAQADVTTSGHALECRLYAEDPGNDDLPSPGRILLCVPPEGPGVRFDTGVATGSDVSIHYDPMLAKIVTHGRDRAEAVERMRDALAQTAVLGVRTNHTRLLALLRHEAFQRGAIHTGFLDEHAEALEWRDALPDAGLAAVAAALHIGSGGARGARSARAVADPWQALGAWRLGGRA